MESSSLCEITGLPREGASGRRCLPLLQPLLCRAPSIQASLAARRHDTRQRREAERRKPRHRLPRRGGCQGKGPRQFTQHTAHPVYSCENIMNPFRNHHTHVSCSLPKCNETLPVGNVRKKARHRLGYICYYSRILEIQETSFIERIAK